MCTVQRCTVHKERNLPAHAPKHLHDEIKADFSGMMYAVDAETLRMVPWLGQKQGVYKVCKHRSWGRDPRREHWAAGGAS